MLQCIIEINDHFFRILLILIVIFFSLERHSLQSLQEIDASIYDDLSPQFVNLKTPDPPTPLLSQAAFPSSSKKTADTPVSFYYIN